MPKTIRSETDALDAISPDTHPGFGTGRRGGSIIAACYVVTSAEDELRAAGSSCRAAGYSWTVIGAALDTTPQSSLPTVRPLILHTPLAPGSLSMNMQGPL